MAAPAVLGGLGRVVGFHVGLDPVVAHRQQRDPGPPAGAERGGDLGERAPGPQHPAAHQMGGQVAVAEGEPARLGPVARELGAHRPRLAAPPPAALFVAAAAEGVHAAVQVRADPQAMQPGVVADVDHRGDLVLDRMISRADRGQTEGRLHAEQEAGTAHPAGQHHDLHDRPAYVGAIRDSVPARSARGRSAKRSAGGRSALINGAFVRPYRTKVPFVRQMAR